MTEQKTIYDDFLESGVMPGETEENIWQGKVEIVKLVKPPVFKVRTNYTCPYCHRLNWVYFMEENLHLKPEQVRHETCKECGAVWQVRLLSAGKEEDKDGRQSE